MAMNSRSDQEMAELKEITPSIAPSIMENTQYTKKWRVILAVLLGVTMIGVCLLGFYVSVEARKEGEDPIPNSVTKPMAATVPLEDIRWREDPEACYSATNGSCPNSRKTVLLLGIDGLRYDYITPELTPALYHLAKCGVQSEGLIPVYPSSTFSNLYSIATVCYNVGSLF